MKATTEEDLKDNYPSPCIKECCLNNEDICLGCYRALDEIVGWVARNDDEKREILRKCSFRKNQ